MLDSRLELEEASNTLNLRMKDDPTNSKLKNNYAAFRKKDNNWIELITI
jgi:hypothetical protein